MFKKQFITVNFLFIIGLVNAQNVGSTKQILGVSLFTTAAESPMAPKFLSSITERVVDVAKKSNRLQVIDLTSNKARENALKRSQENYKAENWLESGKALNAEYVLTGDLGLLKFIKITSTQPNGYKASIAYTIKIIKTETGEITKTQTFSSYDTEISLMPETAFQKAIESTEQKLLEYFLNEFALTLKIAKLSEEKNGRANGIILQGGATTGAKVGDMFSVVLIDRSLGSPLPKEIGKVKLTTIINDYFSECKVIGGGENISKHFSNKDEIECTLIKK